jgi:catechol 2,3-dioxygenase-like lactoylglutathione lyase family enzyme
MHTHEPPRLFNFIMIPVVILAALISGGQLLAQTAPPTGDANPLQLSPHHATTSVADIEKEAKWYEQILGFHEAQRFKNGTDSELRQMVIPGYRIDLVWQRGSVRPAGPSGNLKQGWFHVVFRTPVIDADYKRLVDMGTDVKAFRDDKSAITRLTFHDPEGNELEIVVP